MRTLSILLVFGFILSFANAQDTSDYVAYTRSYKFKDGLFLNFEQVKNNTPIPKDNIITSINKANYDFYDLLILENSIVIVNSQGAQETYLPEDLWGFAENGKLNIFWEERPALVPIVGSISHFVGTHVYEDYAYNNDPFAYNSEPTQRVEVRQYIIDFSTGNILNFNYRDIDPLFAKDEDLYLEWSDLSKRKKKKLILVYLQKYNSRNPLMLPKN